MILNNNLDFLSKSIKNNIQNTKSEKIQFKQSKDNHLIPVYNNIALHSLYYPLKEGDRNNLVLEKNELCIAVGFGAGYHLTKIAEKNKTIIAIPVDNKIFSEIIQKIDLSKYFKNHNLKIINVEELSEYFDINRFESYKMVIHPVMERIFSNEILKIIKNISTQINPMLLEIKTQKKFGKLWFHNIIKNFKYFLENNYDFSPLIIKQKPILITGAGPSLSNNIELIKKYEDDIFIAATDSSLKVLLKNSIIPDAVFSFDVQTYSYLNFCGCKNKTRIFTDFTSSLRYCGNQTIVFSNHPINKIFIESGFAPVYLHSDTMNIGGAMINFFKNYFPDHSIITAGIDYGYYKFYSYAKGTYLDEYKLIYSNFFNSPENIDTELFYKKVFTKSQNNWKTTSLLLDYSSSLNSSDIYTLSKSPYINQKQINILDEIIKSSGKIKERKLDFVKTEISKENFYFLLEKEIKNNPEIIKSYCISKNINLEDYGIDKILDSIKKIIF